MSIIPQHVSKIGTLVEINCDVLTSDLLRSSIDFHILTDFLILSVINEGT